MKVLGMTARWTACSVALLIVLLLMPQCGEECVQCCSCRYSCTVLEGLSFSQICGSGKTQDEVACFDCESECEDFAKRASCKEDDGVDMQNLNVEAFECEYTADDDDKVKN